MALPRYIALKSTSNNAYMRCCSSVEEDGGRYGFLKFNGNEVLSHNTKFEVVKAKSGKGLVHVRSCYNNKYWRRERADGQWILASADQPEEDQTNWSCTLFELVFVNATTVRFRHVQFGFFASLLKLNQPYDLCLFLNSATSGPMDLCTIIDFELLMILPKHVAFKGDNGGYLATAVIKGQQYIQCKSSNNDIGNPFAWTEIFTNGDGSIRIKSKQVNKFWSANPQWIWANATDSTTNKPNLFWPIKVDNNVIALRNLGNNQFCKRLIEVDVDSCFNAQSPAITVYERIQIEEIVLLRSIYNVDFRLQDAMLYGQSIVTMATGTATNRTSDPKTIDVKLSYTDTRSNIWNSSASLKLIDNSTIQSGVPVIDDQGKVQLADDEFNGTYKWGNIESSKNAVETVYAIALAPMTMVKVNLLATKGSCVVPFSYSQRDLLINGEYNTFDMKDGVYTRTNFFNFKFESKEEPLV